MLTEILLPDSEQLHLEEIHLEEKAVVLKVVAAQLSKRCPNYRANSSGVHSYYQRTLVDFLVWVCQSTWLRLYAGFYVSIDCVKEPHLLNRIPLWLLAMRGEPID